jgi:hypothetical protein
MERDREREREAVIMHGREKPSFKV